MTVNDTIVASATATGRGAISVIRISGPTSLKIAEALSQRAFTPRIATLGSITTKQDIIDTGIWLYFPSPASFTGEDVIEFQGHGGPVVTQAVIAAVIEEGARLANPGEFTERAFLNGKIDLTQAEAISDLISASSIEAVKAANRSMQGEFGRHIQSLVDQLKHLRTHIEAHIDFPDEEIDPDTLTSFSQLLQRYELSLLNIIEKANHGAALNNTTNIVLIGAPNTGKSSLLNALARAPLAIVTDIPGTTRDLIRHNIVINGLELQITDTAGIRLTDNPIETEGIKRAYEALSGADFILCLFDAQITDIQTADVLNLFNPDNEDATTLLVRNKIDLYPKKGKTSSTFPLYDISAVTGEGINTLISAIHSQLGIIDSADTFLARSRHIIQLKLALKHLKTARENPLTAEFIDLVAEDLRLAQNALSEITGRFTSEDLLTEIFSSFCIGK